MFFSEPGLWRELLLNGASLFMVLNEAREWFAAKARLLSRVGGFVQRLHYIAAQDCRCHGGKACDIELEAAECGSDWQLGSSVLARLNPATLQTLQIEVTTMNAAAAAELQRLSGLAGLSVTCYSPVPSCVVAALPSLPQLQSLQLSGDSLPLGLPTALQQLTQLPHLHCATVGYHATRLPHLSAVFPLTRLRKLEWEEHRQEGLLRVDVQQLLAHLPQLEHCAVCGSGFYQAARMQV